MIKFVRTGLFFFLLAVITVVPTEAARADAVVLVNSASSSFTDYGYFVKPYLDHFGIPYTVVNISSAPVTADIADYALIIIGQQETTRRALPGDVELAREREMNSEVTK